MMEFTAYPIPPHEEQPIPKFELFVNYREYTWICILFDEKEYDGTYSINRLTGQIHIDWYGIPQSDEFWEEVESQLRTLISSH